MIPNIWKVGTITLIIFSTLNCSKKEESESFDQAYNPITASIKPKVIEVKDTFKVGEKIAAKVYLSRTDFKTLAMQAGIRDYLKVYYHHGDHIEVDSLKGFEKAPVEFDTGYVEFKPKATDSELDIISYPYDVVIQVDYTHDKDGIDTTFVWRQEALLMK
ncbi:hypothetical protein HMI54_012267 [Coelomomyces lativittatus]|nr:hypothetical protein HMI54_012267 [Coelomomyces lativittatus]